MRFNRFSILLVMMLVSLLGGTVTNASTLSFSVEQHLPDNQRNNHSFFDLLVTPQQNQTLSVTLNNETDQEVVVDVSVHTATTGSNGTVNYGPSNGKSNETLPIAMEEILVPESEEVTISPKSKVDFQLQLAIPAEAFSGILAGGITFKEKKKTVDREDETENASLKIENEFAYTIGIVLRENEVPVTPEVELGDVQAGQVNYRNKIVIDLMNIKSAYVNELGYEAVVVKKGDSKIKYTFSSEGLQMAPDSIMPILIPLDGYELKAGQYTLNLKVNSTDQSWEFEKDFNITRKEAKVFNQSEVMIEDYEEESWSKVILLAAVGSILVLVGFLLLKKLRTKKERH